MTTFVLIHGAYQGGWIWKPVASREMERVARTLGVRGYRTWMV